MTQMYLSAGFHRPEVEARYERYVRENFGEIDVPNLCEVMWSAGGREMVDQMVQFAEVPAMIREARQRLVHLERLVAQLMEDR